jgi:hypothetical protein
MNPKHIHMPVSTRPRCPICKQSVYSRAGIHPQCAMKQAESIPPQESLAKAAAPVGPPAVVAAKRPATAPPRGSNRAAVAARLAPSREP